VLGADGRALLAWVTPERGVGTATVTSAGVVEQGALASPLRDQTGATALLLAGGARALAWADDMSLFSARPPDGRLHLALEGATPPPAPPAPRVVTGPQRDRSLRPTQALVIPVRCSAACDLRASVHGDDMRSSPVR
jgi:hypothetical protein